MTLWITSKESCEFYASLQSITLGFRTVTVYLTVRMLLSAASLGYTLLSANLNDTLLTVALMFAMERYGFPYVTVLEEDATPDIGWWLFCE